jgi:hypothetical protein
MLLPIGIQESASQVSVISLEQLEEDSVLMLASNQDR